LDTDQAVTVINWWWKHHSLTGRSEKKLVKAIIPAAWREVSEYVVGWKAAHRNVHTTTCITTEAGTVNPEGRPVSAKTRMVLELANEHSDWGVSRIASAAVVSRQSAWNVLHRHRPDRQVYTTTCITTEAGAVPTIEEIPAPIRRQRKLPWIDDVPEDIDIEECYQLALAQGCLNTVIDQEGNEIWLT
jgi:hypothetical protein